MRRPVWVIMVAADALVPFWRQGICNYHEESTVFMSYWYNYANKNHIIVIKQANFEGGRQPVSLFVIGGFAFSSEITL